MPEFQNGIDVIDSLLHPSSKSNNVLTRYQRDGLHKLRETLLHKSSSTLESTVVIKAKSMRHTSLRKSFTQQLLEDEERSIQTTQHSNHADCDDSCGHCAINQYLLSEFGGIKPKKHRWDFMKAIKANRPIRRIKEMISNRKLNNSGKNLNQPQRSDNVPHEWYEFDHETQIQLSKRLSWENLKRWDFDIFEVSKLCNGRPLLFIGWAILASPHSQEIMEQATSSKSKRFRNSCNGIIDSKGYNFLATYNIPPKCMIDFLRAIEDRYVAENPYHNNMHAADVLQTTHSFLEAMGGKYLGVELSKLEGKGNSLSCHSPMMTLQMFSVLVGAAIHDVGHPGFNNAFQSNSFSQAALTYNDISVLENFHVSLAFQLILGINGNSDWNIFQGMDSDDFIKCKKLITEAVLGTDLAIHLKTLEGIKNITQSDEDLEDEESGSYSWRIMSFLMHMADISNLAKRQIISSQWTDRILSEFFLQGDKEKEMGLPMSPLCNRFTTSRPESQIGFIGYIIRPSFEILKKHLPLIGIVILPLVEENYQYWKLELRREKERKERVSREKTEALENVNVINIVTPSAA